MLRKIKDNMGNSRCLAEVTASSAEDNMTETEDAEYEKANRGEAAGPNAAGANAAGPNAAGPNAAGPNADGSQSPDMFDDVVDPSNGAGEAEAPAIGKEVGAEGAGGAAGALDGILDPSVPQVVSRSRVGCWSVSDLRMAVLHAGTPQHLQPHGQPIPAAELRLPAAERRAGCLRYGAPDCHSVNLPRRRRCKQQRAGLSPSIRSVVAQKLIFKLSFCRYPPSKPR